MSENRDCGADAAAYVLGALEPDEANSFREHLATCVICRDEVSAFQSVADLLPVSVPAQPVPHSLKRRVMAEVRADARAAGSGRATRRRQLRVPLWVTGAITSPALAAAAVVLVLVVAVGAIAIGSSGGSSTRVFNASVTWSGSAKVRVKDGRGELVVANMPAPPRSSVYEVWLQRGQRQPTPTTALFSPTSAGRGSVDVPGDLHGVRRIMVTTEPAGGSAVPTHPAVLVARLG